MAAPFAHEQLDALAAERPGFAELIGAALRAMRALGDDELRQMLVDALAPPQRGVAAGKARLQPSREQRGITPARSDSAAAPAHGHIAPPPAAAAATSGAAARPVRFTLRSTAVDEGSSEDEEAAAAGDIGGGGSDSDSDDDSDGEFEWFGVRTDYEREPGVAEARAAVAAMFGAAADTAEAQAAGRTMGVSAAAPEAVDDDEFVDIGALAASAGSSSVDDTPVEEGRAQPADSERRGATDGCSSSDAVAEKAQALASGDVLRRVPDTKGLLLPVQEEGGTANGIVDDAGAGNSAETGDGAGNSAETGDDNALERLRTRAQEATAAAEDAWKRVPRTTPRTTGIGAGIDGYARLNDGSTGDTGVLGMAGLSFEPKFSSERPPSLDEAFLRQIGNSSEAGDQGATNVFDACPPPPMRTDGPVLTDGNASDELPFSRETNDALKKALAAVAAQYSPRR